MGKSYSRNPDSENYRDNVRKTRKQRKQERQDRHRRDEVMDSNLESDDDYGKHSDDFLPRRNDW